MKDILNIFSYTFYENARKKVFIISSIIILSLTIIALSIPGFIKYFENNENDGGKQAAASKEKIGVVYVVDEKGDFVNKLAEFKEKFTGYDFKAITADKINNIKEEIKEDKTKSMIVFGEKDGVPYYNYWVKQKGNGINEGDLDYNVKKIFVSKTLSALSVSPDVAEKVMLNYFGEVKELGKSMMKSYMSSMIVITLLFFAVYFYGYGVCMSVASEKTSRVMEILLTSSKPSKIIIGKSIAMGLLGLCQLVLIPVTAIVTSKLCFPKDFSLFGEQIDFSNFSPFIIVMLVLYFMLGYSLYAMMNAVAGATVSKAEDLNSAVMPISLITTAVVYLAYGAIGMPDGELSVVTSIIPFAAPFSMPSRLMMTDVPTIQIIASLLAMTVTIVFMAWVSIRMYSNAVLHYGKRLKLSDLVRAAKQ